MRMIRSFRHPGLARYFHKGEKARLAPALVERIRRVLYALDAAGAPGDIDLPGMRFHPLRGKPKRYSAHVNGPWCITFGWDGSDACDVDLENYH